jgi:processive 1,2-diacylglycerol beta-glucosyltransferase
MSGTRKVLILPIRAGAGHLRAAAAIEEAFHERYPDVEVKNVEALLHTNAAFRESFTRSYNSLATDLPSIWGMIYEKMEDEPAKSRLKRMAELFDRMNSRPLTTLVKEFDPDAVVCTHYFPAETLAARRRKGKLRGRLYVTLTDYDIHTMWIQRGVDHYFVATDEMAHALREKGIDNATVSVSGIPIVPSFAQSYPGPTAMRE